MANLSSMRYREKRKFGWDDLFDLLNTAAGVYTGVKGIQEAGKRTTLAEEKFGYEQGQDTLAAERQAVLDARAGELHEAGMQESGYSRIDPAEQGPMPTDVRTVGDTWQKLPGYQEDVTRRGAAEDRQAVFDEYSKNLPSGAELLPTGGGGYRGVYPPDYGQRGVGDTGPSEPDIDRYLGRAEDVADRHMMQRAYEGGEGFLDPMSNNAPNRGHPEWQQVYNEALQGFMDGGEDVEEGPPIDLMANLRDLALGVIAGDAEDIAGLAALHQLEPGVAAVVDSMIEEIQGAGAGTVGGKVGGLLEMLSQGMGLAERAVALPGQTAENLAALPGRVQAAPGVIGERAQGVSEEAWPLKTLWQLLGR